LYSVLCVSYSLAFLFFFCSLHLQQQCLCDSFILENAAAASDCGKAEITQEPIVFRSGGGSGAGIYAVTAVSVCLILPGIAVVMSHVLRLSYSLSILYCNRALQ